MLSIMYNGEYLTIETENDIFNPDFERNLFAAQNSFHINIESDKTIEEFKADLLNNNFANEWSAGNYKVLDAARSYCAKFEGCVAVCPDESRPYWGDEKVWEEEYVNDNGWSIIVKDIENAICAYLHHEKRKLERSDDEELDSTNYRMADYDYKGLFDKLSDPENFLIGWITDLDSLSLYKKSRPDLHIAEDGHYKIPLTAKGKELYRAGIALGIVDFAFRSAINKNKWTTIYEEHKEMFDKMLKDAGITEDNKDTVTEKYFNIRDKVINFKAYRIKDYKGVEKNIKRFKNDILSEVLDVGRLAKKTNDRRRSQTLRERGDR